MRSASDPAPRGNDLLRRQGDYLSLFRAESHASILSWAGIIPFIGWLIGLWHLPVTVVILENVYG